MSRKEDKLHEALEELAHWLQSEDPKYGEFIMRILASLPGGERAEDAGFEPHKFLGWKEVMMLTDLLDAIQDKEDVEEAVDYLMGDGEDEEEDEEEEEETEEAEEGEEEK